MSKAINPFGPDAQEPTTIDVRDPVEVKQTTDWQARRDRGMWYGVVGIGLMFAGQISTAFSVGGAFMVIFGIVEYVRWSMRRPKDEDPWRDPDIDAWEATHYADGEDAPEITDEEPEEALGLHDRF